MLKLTRTLFLCLALPAMLLSATTSPGNPGAKDEKPSASVLGFLKWYQKNHERLDQMNLVFNYNNGKGPTGKNYEMDHNTAEKYMTEIKKSTFIHAKLVEKWRKHFKKVEEDLRADPQSSGVPRGFETDLVMLSSDFDTELSSLDKAEIVSETIESNNYALVKLKFTSGRVFKYELAKQNNKWLITDIIY